MKKKVCCRMFRGTLTTWEELFREAADFATLIGEENLISLSHSSAHSDGVVTVWYGDQWLCS